MLSGAVARFGSTFLSISAVAAFVVFRYLPHQAAHAAGTEGALDAMEVTAELGLAGVEPAYDD